MWKYIKRYFLFAVLAALFMFGEVLMDLIQPTIMARIIDEGVLGAGNQGNSDLTLIIILGIVMIGLVLFGGLCGSLNNVFVHMTGQNIGNEIRKDCFRHIMTFSFVQADDFGAGSLITRTTNDITQVQNFISQFVRGMIRTFMLMLGSIYFIYRLNHRFGLIVTGAFPFILGCMVLCLHLANPLLPRLQVELDQMNALLQEDISGIRIIKACVREMYEKLRFKKKNDELIHTQLHILMIFAFMNPTMNALVYLVLAVIMMAGQIQVGQGITTPGTIMATITYTTQMLNGILMLVMLFQTISKGVASWERIKEVLDEKPEIVDGSEDILSDKQVAEKTSDSGKVEFCDVSFAFPETKQKILQHINLTIEPGETIAIMGATGCGKSTLVQLIPRFYDVTEGEIRLNGKDIRDYPKKQLRDKIAMVLQKSELFYGTIRENVAWGDPEADEAAIISAAQIAQADHFIKEMPDGYETVVEEKGASLSGGQKQRISIARAVLKQAEVMIFDDSTSALDLKTEAEFYEALEKTKSDCTKILIAQRIASVRRADRIVILNAHTIEACGTHEELLRSSSTYRDIYDSQMGEEEK